MAASDNVFPNNAVVVGKVGNQKIIENVGAKRVMGTELVTLGKVPQFLYYLVNISSLCVYANDGSNTWMGAFGYPVAGTLQVRDSLQPFEGQRFYLIDTDISYEYRGGAWQGGVVEGITLAPTYLVLKNATGLTHGRKHLIAADGDYVLPDAINSTKGDSLEGHEIVFTVVDGFNATVSSPDGMTYNGVTLLTLELATSNLYTAVFESGKWRLSYTVSEVGGVDIVDYIDQQDQLVIDYVDQEVAELILVDESLQNQINAINSIVITRDVNVVDGLTKTGSLPTDDLILGVDFATELEALDPTNTSKVINPATLAAVSVELAGASQYNNITGLFPLASNPKFSLTTAGNLMSVSYVQARILFNSEPYSKSQAVTFIDIPANTIAVPNVAGTFTYYILVDIAGTILLTTTRPDPASVTECLLGFFSAVDGVIPVGTLGPVASAVPWLASSTYSLRNDNLSFEGLKLFPSTTQGQLSRSAYTANRESINWENSTVDPHGITFAALDPVMFTYVDSAGTPVGTIGTSFVDGRTLDDGSAVPNNRYSIQVSYLSAAGENIVLFGNTSYNSMIEATAAIEGYIPTIPDAIGNALEIARWAIRDDQFESSPTTDLTDSDKFQVNLSVGSGTGGQLNNASDIISSNTSNTLLNTNVQSNLDELSERTEGNSGITEAQFNALRDTRIRDNAGSGFLEWGKHVSTLEINEGMWTFSNALELGRPQGEGNSRTDMPITLVNGVRHNIDFINSIGGVDPNTINFPPAPNGTKTYNSVTGEVIQHADTATAFAAETINVKVITSRKDLCFLETWHEVVSDKGIVVPLGNVQYGAPDYKGITLVGLDTLGVGQGYSAFGEWDTTTQGLGVQWESLTTAEQRTFVSDPDNNLYFKLGVGWIQVRYRVRVVEGLGDSWATPFPILGNDDALKYDNFNFVNAQGSSVSVTDTGISVLNYLTGNVSFNSDVEKQVGLTSTTSAFTDAYEGKCFTVPIALVQRLNQGGYHPVHNPQGCDRFTGGGFWYGSSFATADSTLYCFLNKAGDGDVASGITGRSDQYEYFDAIYTGMVEDLRLNANKLDYTRLLEDGMRSAITGATRGKTKVPFTVTTQTVTVNNIQIVNAGNALINVGDLYGLIGADRLRIKSVGMQYSNGQWTEGVIPKDIATFLSPDSSYIVVQLDTTGLNTAVGTLNLISYESDHISAEYDSVPMVDIIGNPANIAATFPEGVIGQWIPYQIVGGGNESVPLNRKSSESSAPLTFTSDNGATWTQALHTINLVTNELVTSPITSMVLILQYESLSDFTESEVNSAILVQPTQTILGCNSESRFGNRVSATLTGNVNTGNASPSVQYSQSRHYADPVTYVLFGGGGYASSNGHLDPNNLVANFDTGGVKYFNSLIEKDGLLYLQYHGRELVYDTDWGDDSTIPIGDGNYTVTDLNGTEVKAFCHHDMIPIGIADNTESN